MNSPGANPQMRALGILVASVGLVALGVRRSRRRRRQQCQQCQQCTYQHYDYRGYHDQHHNHYHGPPQGYYDDYMQPPPLPRRPDSKPETKERGYDVQFAHSERASLPPPPPYYMKE
ncbi:hypothetical protein SEUCBS139899_004291 [Sporothrix eucalyptigena]|uniref:Secreted protein n=1 Tax=Sporothrix eucalyptigena TaxID=1812306 RepID=A0ABP0BSN1_9PEZI